MALSVETILSKRTAMARTNVPEPVKTLILGRDLKGTVLNFGCGKDTFTKKFLESQTEVSNVDNYDPNFEGVNVAPKNKYDIVLSVYVLNSLPPFERREAVIQMMSFMKEGGVCYVIVRAYDNSIGGEPEKDGVRTKVKTFQRPFYNRDIEKYLKKYFRDVKIIHGGRNQSRHIVECKEPKK